MKLMSRVLTHHQYLYINLHPLLQQPTKGRRRRRKLETPSMAETIQSPDSPPPVPAPVPATESVVAGRGGASSSLMSDIFQWRKKKQSFLVLAISTLTWVSLEIYQFNFITLASWLIMAVVSLMFIYGNLLRLLGKEKPNNSNNMSTGLEVSEESAISMAITLKGYVEEVIRKMFDVGAERDWFMFVKVIGGLWVLSIVGSWFDFPTFLYTGILMGMSVPMIYLKYEAQIKRCGENMKVKGRKLYERVDEKVLRKMKDKLGLMVEKKEEEKEKEKEKKVE